MATTANLGLEILTEGQANKEASITEAHQQIDALSQGVFLDRDLATPPGSPAAGDVYLVASSATGAWSGQDGKIAHYRNGAWTFITPKEGWRFYVADEDKFIVYDGSSWSAVGGALDVQDGGSSVVGEATALNFTGSGVSVSDGGGGRADITISGGGNGTVAGTGFIGAKVSKSASQTIPDTSVTVITWETEDIDTDGGIVDLANNHLLVPASLDGAYVEMGLMCDWASNSSGFRQLIIEHDTGGGFVIIAQDVRNAVGSAVAEVSAGPILVSTGDKFRASVQQNSGGNLNVDSPPATSFWMKVLSAGGRAVDEETGTTRTLAVTDNDQILHFTGTASPAGATITIPDTLPSGFVCRVWNSTGGNITISAGGSPSVTLKGDTTISDGQGAEIWMLASDVAAVSAY